MLVRAMVFDNQFAVRQVTVQQYRMSRPKARRIRVHHLLTVAVLAFCSSSSRVALADDARDRAAKAFDEGVQAYDRAAYADAARAFLRADEALPSADALSNALAAAHRAGDHMLVVRIATRAIAREAREPALAVKARQALADAATHLSKIGLGCEPTPCTLSLDGEPAERGFRYVMPGTHAVAADAAGGAHAEESLNLAAGAQYRVVLHPTKPGETARKSDVKAEKTPAAKAPARHDEAPTRDRGSDRPLPPALFYAGVGLTLGLAGVTTWSGIDAISAKSDLPARPTTGEVDDVRGKARRTDVLLGVTLLVGAATAYAGIALVDFGGRSRGARLTISPMTRSVALGGWFP
jgi:hypothetical protein